MSCYVCAYKHNITPWFHLKLSCQRKLLDVIALAQVIVILVSCITLGSLLKRKTINVPCGYTKTVNLFGSFGTSDVILVDRSISFLICKSDRSATSNSLAPFDWLVLILHT